MTRLYRGDGRPAVKSCAASMWAIVPSYADTSVFSRNCATAMNFSTLVKAVLLRL